MSLVSVKITQLENGQDLPLPSYATAGSAGMDLSAAIPGDEMIIAAGEIKLVPAGIAIALPVGFEAQIRPRSGLAAKHGISLVNSPGTIDSDYRGEIKVIMINHGKEEFVIQHGMRIAQMVVAPVTLVGWNPQDNLEDDSERGSGGFGSTGM